MNKILQKLLGSVASISFLAFPLCAASQAPQAPTIAAGSIAVTRQGATTVVTQSSQKGIIDWRSFSIGPQEAVRFDQPGRSSVTLNRVMGTEASRIDGSLSATGQVWLANPNGVLIGPGGQVNVGGLMATTGRVDAQAFLATGRAQIDQIAKDAAIVNAGQITVGEGGYAALAAAAIRNDGVIAARSGSVALGAGKAMTLDFAGDKLISFQVAQPLDQAPANAEALIANDGLIAARGGNVFISARAAKGVIDNVVNLKGHVISDAVRVDGGTVIFGDGGAVRVSGRIDASRAAGAGGSVTVLGEKVGLMDGAAIDASGATGGGTVLIGGDWQGKGDPGANGQNALVTYVAPTASITAEATQSGVGGKIVVWADDATRFNGQISAPGGKVETSGKKTLTVGATAKVKAGAWLLDPSDITIQPGGTGSLTGGVFDPAGVSTIDPATITAGLTTGDVTIQTSSGAGGSGDITFGGTISTASGTIRTLTLLADRNILITNGTITMTGAAHNVVLNSRASGAAEGAIVIGASTFSTISTTGGTISLVGGVGGAGAARGSAANVNGVVLFSTTLSAGAGAIVVNGTGRLGDSASQIFGVLVQTSTLSANGGITITGGSGDQASAETYGVFTTGSSLTAGGSGSIAITGSAIGSSPTAVGVRVNGAMSLGSGPLNITGSSSGTGQGVVSGAPISSAGDVTLQASGSSGDIKIGGTISTTSGTIRTLKLLADRNIEFASGTITMIGAAHDVVLNTRASGAAEGAIFMNGNALISTTGGTISLVGGVSGAGGAGGSGAFSVDGVAVYDSTLSAGAGAIVVNGAGRLGDASAVIYGVRLQNSALSAGGGITITGVSGDQAGSATVGVYALATPINAGSIAITGSAAGIAPSAGGVLIGSGVAMSIGAGGLNIVGTSTGSGTAGNSHGVELGGSTISSVGGVTVNGTAGGGPSHGVNLVGTLISTGGSISITGTRGSGANSNNISTSAGLLQTVGGDITLLGTATTGGGASGNSGVRIVNSALVNTSTGTIAITGAGASAGSLNDGVVIGTLTSTATITATGATGAIIVNGSRGAGRSTNISVYGATLATQGGSLVLNGPFAGSGGSVVNTGVMIAMNNTNVASLTTTNGAISITGTGGAASNSDGVSIGDDLGGHYGGVTIAASGSGSVQIVGTRGGAPARNIYVYGALTQISTNSGALTLNGAAITAGGALDHGVFLTAGPVLTTATGTISISGAGATSGAGNDGVNINAATVTTTGVGGVIQITGLSGATGSGINNINGLVRTGNLLGDMILTADSVIANNQYLFGANNGTIFIRPDLPNKSIGVDGGAGAFQVSLDRFNGRLDIGRPDLTAPITVGAGAVFFKPTTLTTGGGAINFVGAINGALGGGFNLTLNAGPGSVSFGGSVGASTPFDSLAKFGIGTLYVGGTVATIGAQSYAGPIILTGASVLSTTNGLISSAGSIDGPGSLTASINAAGSLSFGAAVGGVTPLASFTQLGTGAVAVSGAIRASGSQSYAGSVTLGGGASFSTTSGDLIFSGPVDGSTVGGQNLTALVIGAISLAGGAGATTALSSINLTNSVFLGGIIATTGAQTYQTANFLTNTTIVTSNSPVLFNSMNDGPGGVTFNTGSGNVTLGANVGAGTPLAFVSQSGTGQLTVFNNVITTGAQSYSSAIIIAGAGVFSTSNAAVTFGGPIDAAAAGAYGMTVSAGAATVSFGNNFGVATALSSFTQIGGGNLLLGGTHITTGTQNYGGSVISSGSANITSYGADIGISGDVNGQTGAESLLIQLFGPYTVNFGGIIGAGNLLHALTINTTTGAVSLPNATVTNLTINSSGGAIGQTGSLTVSGAATIASGAGAIFLNAAQNDINQISVASTGPVSITDGVGGLSILGATASSLSLSAVGAVTQSGSITASILQIGGAGDFTLTGSNAVDSLSGGGAGFINFTNMSLPGLTVGGLTGGAITLAQTGTGASINVAGAMFTSGIANLTASGDLYINGALNAGSAILTSGGAIGGVGTVTATALTLSVTGAGSSINATVNGQTGAAAAALITVLAGTISANGAAITPIQAPAPNSPSVASTATIASMATVATVASIPSVATVASVGSPPSTASIASTPSVATVSTQAPVPALIEPDLESLQGIPIETLMSQVSALVASGLAAATTAGSSASASIAAAFGPTDADGAPRGSSTNPNGSSSREEAAPARKDDLPDEPASDAPAAPTTGPRPAGGPSASSPANGASARSIAAAVTATASGALAPPTPPSVGATGAPLISSRTIKVDAADTGGANGQVVAARGGGPAANAMTSIVPGLVSSSATRADSRAGPEREPPLDQQPSQMNEEAFLD